MSSNPGSPESRGRQLFADIPGSTVFTVRTCHRWVAGVGPVWLSTHYVSPHDGDVYAQTRDILDAGRKRPRPSGEKPFCAVLFNDKDEEIYRCRFDGTKVVTDSS